jgi:hypothetical protein
LITDAFVQLSSDFSDLPSFSRFSALFRLKLLRPFAEDHLVQLFDRHILPLEQFNLDQGSS